MKWLPLFLLLTASALADPPRSHLPPDREAFFAKLHSGFMQVIQEGSTYFDEDLGDYPWLARMVQADFFKWDPSGKGRRMPPLCDAKIWQSKSLATSIDPHRWAGELETFLKSCHVEWETPWTDIITNAVGMMSFKLHPNRYPYGRHVMFFLPNGIKVKGLLAMKTDGKKRPLVIFRTGLFSNVQEFYPERSLFFQLFEQSPFNLLVLESSSGSEFLKHNTSFAIGGFDEGLQNFMIAQGLQDPKEPVSQFVQSVHLMGSSLGGHGVLFSALLNQLNPGPQGQPVIRSALAFCPLLNMQETLDFHMSQGFSMDLMNYWASHRLKAIKERIPGIRNEDFIYQFFNWIKTNYKGPLVAEKGHIEGIRLPKEAEEMLSESKTPEDLYWRLNHYWPWYHKVQTPVLILSNRKDPIVSWFINSGRIEDQRMKLQDSELKLFAFEQGYHCSLPISYDWKALTTVFQTFVLKLSPDFQLKTKELRVPLSEKVLTQFKQQNPYLSIDYDVAVGTAGVFARIRFDEDFSPSLRDRFLAPRMTAQLPLSEMEFPIESLVSSEDEASLLRRWAHQNIEARIEGSDLVFSWPQTP
ncbi:MAG: hypothetical protein ACAH59_09280 [Pseudobdellovibrionaceae bacterium]